MKKTISKEYWVCEHCKDVINEPDQAVIVQGNITVADYSNDTAKIGAGIIGTANIYKNDPPFSEAKISPFHSICFVKSIMKSFDLDKYDLE